MNWRDQAACQDHEPELWFRTPVPETARLICGGCPVRIDCLCYAIDNDMRHGYWGGMTPTWRRRIALVAQRSPKKPPLSPNCADCGRPVGLRVQRCSSCRTRRMRGVDAGELPYFNTRQFA